MWKLLINSRDTGTNVLVSPLLTLTTLTMLTIFTFCFRVFTTNFGQVNAGSYFNASFHWCSQQNMLLLNVNRINQTGFFQRYLHHSLPQWYPQNFHMIHFCTRNTQPYILNHVLDMNINLYDIHFLRLIYICSEQISVLILELIACQFWLVSTPHLQTSTPILQVLSSVDQDISTDKFEDVLVMSGNTSHAL